MNFAGIFAEATRLWTLRLNAGILQRNQRLIHESADLLTSRGALSISAQSRFDTCRSFLAELSGQIPIAILLSFRPVLPSFRDLIEPRLNHSARFRNIFVSSRSFVRLLAIHNAIAMYAELRAPLGFLFCFSLLFGAARWIIELQLAFLCNYAFFLRLIKMNNVDVSVMMPAVDRTEAAQSEERSPK